MFRKLIATPHDPAATVLRIVLGGVIFVHGSQKVFGWFGGPGFSATLAGFAGMGFPAPLAMLAVLAESAGAIALVLGLLGRVAAAGIAVVMLVTWLKVHAQFGFFMNWSGQQKGEGYEYHLLALAMAIALMIRGSGAWSVDRALSSTSDVRTSL